MFPWSQKPTVPSTPQRSTKDLYLDSLRKKYLDFRVMVYDSKPPESWRPKWQSMLDNKECLIVIRLPGLKGYSDVRYQYYKFISPGPQRSDVQKSGGFFAYCHSSEFRALILNYVTKWQVLALEYNVDSQGIQPLDERIIYCPTLTALLLNPDDGELDLAKEISPHHFDPPSSSPQIPAKIQPQPPAPGISNVLGGFTKRKP